MLTKKKKRVSFLWVCGLWWVFHAPVDGSSPMHVWTELIGYSELRSRKRDTERNRESEIWKRMSVIGLRKRRGEMYDYVQNTLSACMEFMKNKI